MSRTRDEVRAQRKATTGPGGRGARGGGVFGWLGTVVVRWPWVIIMCWVTLALALPQAFPSLDEMSQRNPVAILPADAPVNVAARQMTQAFKESGSENILLVVLTDDKGLSPADEDTYGRLVDAVGRDTQDVVMMQDFLTTPALKEVLASKDDKAWILPVGLAGELGTPRSYDAYTRVAQIVEHTVAGTTLTAHLTGPAATVADLTDIGARDRLRIEIAIAVMLLVILLVIYRGIVTILLPLITIGASLVTAQAVIAGVSDVAGLGVSNQTIILLSGMIAGAGTDYAVFLISRYHDYVRLGADSNRAVQSALTSVGKVIAASAATVGITFIGLGFTTLGLFSTAGVALAIAVGVAFLAAVTLLPAVMVIAGPGGWISPSRELTAHFWRRSGIRIVRRPKTNLVASLVVLAMLAGFATIAHYNYDDRKVLPDSVGSSVGYTALESHFPLNSTIPQYLFVTSPRDLRTSQSLADLEQMAQRVSQLPDIDVVRGITRPTGQSLEQARLSYQAGEVGNRIGEASGLIKDRTDELDRLATGSDTVANGLRDANDQISQAIGTVGGLVETLASMQNQLGGGTMLQDLDAATELIDSMQALGDAIGAKFGNPETGLDWVPPVLAALNASPICNANPDCVAGRIQLQKLDAARTNGTLARMAELARQLQVTQGINTLASTVRNLSAALQSASAAMQSLGIDDPVAARTRLDSMQSDAARLADGSRQVADGVRLLVDQVKTMGGGLGDAAAFLQAMNSDASSPSMSGFYIPAQILDRDDFRQAAQIFISPDGHAARYLVQTKLNPFSTAAMDQVTSITDTARSAQPNTTLADADVSMVGYSVTLRDTRDYYDRDIRFIITVTILVVLLILIVLLRAIVAPLYLIASVVISYLAAMGLGVIMFQLILGQELHWSIPGLTFIILVAVGADYNLLLISRIRDESPPGIRTGVIRTVGSTGGVITAAGLIFAASMFGLLFSSISTAVQVGFVIGVGILLDTFLVRTVTVPAMAVLVGRANWWPSRPRSVRDGPGGERPSAPATAKTRLATSLREVILRIRRVYAWQ